jgi:hypothetical protein
MLHLDTDTLTEAELLALATVCGESVGATTLTAALNMRPTTVAEESTLRWTHFLYEEALYKAVSRWER